MRLVKLFPGHDLDCAIAFFCIYSLPHPEVRAKRASKDARRGRYAPSTGCSPMGSTTRPKVALVTMAKLP